MENHFCKYSVEIKGKEEGVGGELEEFGEN